MLATLLLSQGVPMLLAGDERNRTQRGNNNAYCQDNELSWVDWRLDDAGRELLAFTRRLIEIRKAHPALHRRSFFQGRSIHGPEVRDIEWFRPDGQEMSDEEWAHSFVRCLGMLLNGQVMDEWGERGEHIRDDIFLLLLNAYWETIPFTLPTTPDGQPWEVLVDTTTSHEPEGVSRRSGAVYDLQARSLALLIWQATKAEE
jgi:isoamylase